MILGDTTEKMNERRQSATPGEPAPLGTRKSLGDQSIRRSSSNLEAEQARVIGSHAISSRAPGSDERDERVGNKPYFVSNGLPVGDTKTRTVADLRAARESRANEALKMKDEQLRILQDQNSQLLRNLDR